MTREIYTNIKTGDLYEILSFDVIDATSGPKNGTIMVAYEKVNTGQVYVREIQEFNEKFKKVD